MWLIVFAEKKTILEWIATSRIYTDEDNAILADLKSDAFALIIKVLELSHHFTPENFLDLVKSEALRDQATAELIKLQK